MSAETDLFKAPVLESVYLPHVVRPTLNRVALEKKKSNKSPQEIAMSILYNSIHAK